MSMGGIIIILVVKWCFYYNFLDFKCYGIDLLKVWLLVVKLGYFFLELVFIVNFNLMVFIDGVIN